MKRSTHLVCLVAAAVLIASASWTASAVRSNGYRECTNVPDQLVGKMALTPELEMCVKQRCWTTTGNNPTGTGASPDGYCDDGPDPGLTERNSLVGCGSFMSAYTKYYDCAMKALAAHDATFKAEYDKYADTPGFPYHYSDLSCSTCNNFESLNVRPARCSSWSCSSCCMQDPTVPPGVVAKGYNQVLCGTGCVAAILMIPFTVISAFIFICCGFCWPSPSLRTKAALFEQEEREEKARMASRRGSHDGSGNPSDTVEPSPQPQ